MSKLATTTNQNVNYNLHFNKYNSNSKITFNKWIFIFILATGNELVKPENPLPKTPQVGNSNGGRTPASNVQNPKKEESSCVIA